MVLVSQQPQQVAPTSQQPQQVASTSQQQQINSPTSGSQTSVIVPTSGQGQDCVLDSSSETPASSTAAKGDQQAGPSSSSAEPQQAVAAQGSGTADDDYNVYYYDPNAIVASVSNVDANAHLKNTYESIFANLNRTLDPWEVLFARAEGLHAHGHSKEACKLGVRLAEELLANPPNLTIIETPPTVCKQQGGRRRNKHINPASWHQVSVLSSNTLQKCAFLCTVLTEYETHHHLAFRVALYGMEMTRPPASTKPLEVKLAHQESELVSLLKRIPLGTPELDIIRDRATQLKDGVLRSRGDALLPITLAGFILDSLISTVNQQNMKPMSGLGVNKKPQYNADEMLGFEAAVSALGLKANVSEAEHPLLCEGTRRQRGELAIRLLMQYKDEPVKIARIMDKLLDREVHQLIKQPVVQAWYYSNNPYLGLRNASGRRHHNMMYNHRDPTESQQASALGSTSSSVDTLGVESSLASMCLNPPPSLTASAMPPSTSYSPNPHTLPHGVGHSTTQNQTSTQNLKKESSRFKSKRSYPCIPNQPSEASAHFTFELSKNLLMKAGGNASTSLFTQPSPSTPHPGSHRGLHMCAFQLGLYALGLHNCVSHNWLSRTYSSHVSWLSGQAMELGTPAILFLIETWEGHLTPPEAASIADKASRGCDPNMTPAAAELALSCLPHAHALNPNEITRAILQCKEQSDLMLEQACLLVENAAKGGGVYPEVLFQVAKYWFELYLRQVPPGNNDQSPFLDFDPTPPEEISSQPPPPPLIEQTPPQFHGHPMYLAPPYSIIPTHWPPPHPHQVYLSSPPAFQYPPHSANQLFSMRVNPHQHPQHHPAMFTTMQVSDGQGGQITVLTSPPHQGPPPQGPPPAQLMQHPPPPPQAPNQQIRPHMPPQHHQVPRQQFRYLLSAYRVGMLAMDTLARRVHDDRPQAKYARNPPYGEDVKWLLRIAAKLGSQYLHQFCVCAVNSIISPFVLHDVAIEAAHYLSRNTPTLIVQHLRTTLAPLMTKCQQMYIHCMNQKLYHLSGADYEDFVSIVCSARNAYEINPNGSQQFKEWLQSIRKSKSCKKDLWQQIQTALQNNSK
uniref:Zinc finger SWIM domain-containing protein 8 n=1 Tax=Cacopsylla melanoneura TaxID=428564 RepID=A0A8D9ETE1_9HEMI